MARNDKTFKYNKTIQSLSYMHIFPSRELFARAPVCVVWCYQYALRTLRVPKDCSKAASRTIVLHIYSYETFCICMYVWMVVGVWVTEVLTYTYTMYRAAAGGQPIAFVCQNNARKKRKRNLTHNKYVISKHGTTSPLAPNAPNVFTKCLCIVLFHHRPLFTLLTAIAGAVDVISCVLAFLSNGCAFLIRSRSRTVFWKHIYKYRICDNLLLRITKNTNSVLKRKTYPCQPGRQKKKLLTIIEWLKKKSTNTHDQ
ncbi:unnamed protein product [Ceratitis capitata]|uniref:(Mediterranean fruit fly) hypothetical protein n=1 Tax=Ceratitis capitata TaxID=7213 RepID=A0A811U558_CERCA|nr:unnamed protein product [Ceratitis capitata]